MAVSEVTAGAAPRRLYRTVSRKIVQWRAMVDEDGQYVFAVAL